MPVAKIVELSALDSNVAATLPKYWIDVFSATEFEARKTILLKEWSEYPYQFGAVTKFLKDNLFDVDLIERAGEISMLYSIKDQGGYSGVVDHRVPEMRTRYSVTL